MQCNSEEGITWIAFDRVTLVSLAQEGMIEKELLTLEALPPFSIHLGLTKRTPRRTRRQERIWLWLIAHKNLPIWKFLRKGGAA